MLVPDSTHRSKHNHYHHLTQVATQKRSRLLKHLLNIYYFKKINVPVEKKKSHLGITLHPLHLHKLSPWLKSDTNVDPRFIPGSIRFPFLPNVFFVFCPSFLRLLCCVSCSL